MSYHVLEISATREDLQDDVKREVRKIGRGLDLRGFRPGRVPFTVIKRLFGKELRNLVADGLIEEVFADLVNDTGEYEVDSGYFVEKLDYQIDEDLKATVGFNVLPVIDLEPVKDVPVNRFVFTCTKEHAVNELKELWGEMHPLSVDDSIEDTDDLVCKVQEVDWDTRAAVIGGYSGSHHLYGDNDDIPSELEGLDEALADAVIGCRLGETVYFHVVVPPQSEFIVTCGVERHFSAFIQEGQRVRLPEFDEDYVSSVTDGSCRTEEELIGYTIERLQKEKDGELRKANQMVLLKFMCQHFPFQLSPARVVSVVEHSETLTEPVVEHLLRWQLICSAMEKQLDIDTSGNGDSNILESVVFDYLAENLSFRNLDVS